MGLVLEIVDKNSTESSKETMLFKENGGIIGSAKEASWRLEDPENRILHNHAKILYKNGKFHLSPAGSAVIKMKKPKKNLTKGMSIPLTKETAFMIGECTIAVKSIKIPVAVMGTEAKAPRENTTEIADTFFKGDIHRKTIDIIDPASPAEDDILSLIESKEERPSGGNDFMIPELDSILQGYGMEDGFADDSLSEHIEPPTLEVQKEKKLPEQTENGKDDEDERILKILSIKLGADTQNMTRKEKEKFAEEVAQLAFAALEHVRSTGSVLQKVQAQLGVTTFSGTSPLKNASETREIFANLLNYRPSVSEQIKNLFHDLEKHTIAFHTAYKNLTSKNADIFSPEKLYFRFTKKGLIKNGLFSKKSQAWEAYCKEFKHLNFVKDDKIDNTELKKEYNRVLDTLSISYNSAKNKAKK